MKIKLLVLLLIGSSVAFAQTKKNKDFKTVTAVTKSANPNEGIFAEIETSKGKIIVQLEYKKTPVTVANFIALAEGTNPQVAEKHKGKKFYDGLKFHRVIKDFMIQGGDPDGNGSGGPGYAFKDEFDPSLVHDKGGILSMANSGPKTNGSQFFITHKETPWLNNKHSIFGSVVTGMDVVNKIEQNDVINTIKINRKGADAKKFDAVKVFSDYFGSKADDDKKQAAIDAENKRIADEKVALAKKDYNDKFGSVLAAKVASLKQIKETATKTDSGLIFKVLQAGTGVKPTEGKEVYVNYAGYLEDGSLFDSSIESVNKEYGKFDQNRANANGYQPFPYQYGNKTGLIPGFIEGLEKMNFGEKAIFFIPANLGYGDKGAGNVIPPGANIIFEVELLEKMPGK